MDAHLRKLQQLVKTDPSFYPAYVRALERAIFEDVQPVFKAMTTSPSKPHKIHDEGLVLEVINIPEYGIGADLVGGYEISTINQETIGYLVSVEWEDSFYPDADEIITQLEESFLDLLQQAREQGYQYIFIINP